MKEYTFMVFGIGFNPESINQLKIGFPKKTKFLKAEVRDGFLYISHTYPTKRNLKKIRNKKISFLLVKPHGTVDVSKYKYISTVLYQNAEYGLWYKKCKKYGLWYKKCKK